MAELLPFAPKPVLAATAELDTWQARLDRAGPLPRRWAGRLRRDLEVEAVAASVGMEQVPVTVDEVRQILAGGRPSSVRADDRELVLGYREAMEYVLRRADDRGFQWNRELVVALHDRVLAGNYALGAGRLATGDRWVVDGRSGQELYVAPTPDELPGLVDEMCERLGRTREHPAVSAAWVHVATAAIHPFRDGNGRVARVLASLAMVRGGFSRREFTSLEEWWGGHLTDYYGAFRCLGPRFARDADVTPFVVTHVNAQLAQVRALDLRLRVERRIWEALEAIVDDIGLQPRVANALWDAFFDRDVTPAFYIPLADVSRATATNDLAAAVAGGLLAPVGAGRSRHYRAGPRLYPSVASYLGIDEGEHDPRKRIVAVLSRALAEPID